MVRCHVSIVVTPSCNVSPTPRFFTVFPRTPVTNPAKKMNMDTNEASTYARVRPGWCRLGCV